MKWMCLILIFTATCLQAETLKTLSFQDLKVSDFEHLREAHERFNSEETIALRGFLYQKEGNWILASEPNLKSCCVGTEKTIDKEIYLENFSGLLNSSNKAFDVQGKLSMQPTWDKDRLTKLYILKEAKIINKASHWHIYGVLIAGMIVSLGMLWTLARHAKRDLQNIDPAV